MAIKTDVQIGTAIDGIADGGANTAADVRGVLDDINDSKANSDVFDSDLTLTGGFSVPNDVIGAWGNNDELTIQANATSATITETSTGNFVIRGENIQFRSQDGSEVFAVFNKDDLAGLYYDNTVKLVTKSYGVRIDGGAALQESASAPSSAIAGYGQLWVRDDSPNVPMFTDDAGTDFQLAVTADVRATRDTVAILLADTALTYTSGASGTVAAGDVVVAGPYYYTVAASGASDHHTATAGGVKLYVETDATGLKPLEALGGDNDGVTSNNTILSAAATDNLSISTRSGVFTSTLAGTALPARISGRGQVEDTDGKRAFSFIRQTASVTKAASHDSPAEAFDGDISKLDRAAEKRITGAATLGQPATGYLQSPENALDFLYVDNASGHNQETASNGGRTGASVLDIRHNHSGNGDFGCIHLKGNASGAKPGATSFLANPATIGINGDFFALNDGVYLNVIELTMNDLGNDAAAIGAVFRFDRSVGTAALGEVWMGVRVQSEGSADSDVGFSVAGKWKRGADFTSATLDGNAAAITMKQGQRIYFGATESGDVGWSQTVGDDHISFDGASIVTTVNGTAALQVNGSDVIVNSSNGLLVAGTGALQMSGASQFFTGATTPSFSATNKPGSNSGGPAQWVKIVLGGTDYVIPAWLVN